MKSLGTRSVRTWLLATFSLLPTFAFAVEAELTDDTTVISATATPQGAVATVTAWAGSGVLTRTALMRFDVCSLLPPGTSKDQIATATLRLYVTSVTGTVVQNVSPGLNLHVNTAAWNELTLASAYNSFNAAVIGADATHPYTLALNQIVAKKYVSIDVTQEVKDWVAAGDTNNFGFIFTPSGTINVSFNSKEGTGVPPVLDITLAGPQGLQGIQGIPGTNGTNGTSGTNGTNGTNGLNGGKGDKGDTGLQGPTGPPTTRILAGDLSMGEFNHGPTP